MAVDALREHEDALGSAKTMEDLKKLLEEIRRWRLASSGDEPPASRGAGGRARRARRRARRGWRRTRAAATAAAATAATAAAGWAASTRGGVMALQPVSSPGSAPTSPPSRPGRGAGLRRHGVRATGARFFAGPTSGKRGRRGLNALPAPDAVHDDVVRRLPVTSAASKTLGTSAQEVFAHQDSAASATGVGLTPRAPPSSAPARSRARSYRLVACRRAGDEACTSVGAPTRALAAPRRRRRLVQRRRRRTGVRRLENSGPRRRSAYPRPPAAEPVLHATGERDAGSAPRRRSRARRSSRAASDAARDASAVVVAMPADA